MREKKAREMVKYFFTDEEKKEFGSSIAQAIKNKSSRELELKSVSTQIKSDIAREDANIDSLTEKIQSGYEYRGVECRLNYNVKKKLVYYIRIDDDETIIRTRGMRAEEIQDDLPIED